MKRIYLMMLFATLAMIVSAQTDDKGYKEGAWVLKGVTGVNMSQTAMTTGQLVVKTLWPGMLT